MAALPPGTAAAAPEAKAATPGTDKPAVKAPGEATIGDRTTCPATHEEFTVTAESPKVEYKGKTYYFCCAGCDKKFSQDPEKYLSKTAKPSA
jgi:YHS domain-containing protein